MKKFLLLALAISGLLALIPSESKAQVTVVVSPGHSSGYYYQRQPYYHRHYYHHYYHRYYHGHYWHND
jgi:hypothetical protein